MTTGDSLGIETSHYYTPKIEDLHVGYEFETYIPRWTAEGKNESKWVKKVFSEPLMYGDTLSSHIKSNFIRTPYLTKEQIEAEGWIYSQDDFLVNILKRVPTHYWFVKNGYGCTLYPDKNSITIEDNRTHMMIQPILYNGLCPSINEFRVICKLLGI